MGSQVRCACRRLKEKRPCAAVRRQLAERGLPPAFEASAAVQLLDCDAKCVQAKVGRRCWSGCLNEHDPLQNLGVLLLCSSSHDLGGVGGTLHCDV